MKLSNVVGNRKISVVKIYSHNRELNKLGIEENGICFVEKMYGYFLLCPKNRLKTAISKQVADSIEVEYV